MKNLKVTFVLWLACLCLIFGATVEPVSANSPARDRLDKGEHSEITEARYYTQGENVRYWVNSKAGKVGFYVIGFKHNRVGRDVTYKSYDTPDGKATVRSFRAPFPGYYQLRAFCEPKNCVADLYMDDDD